MTDIVKCYVNVEKCRNGIQPILCCIGQKATLSYTS